MVEMLYRRGFETNMMFRYYMKPLAGMSTDRILAKDGSRWHMAYGTESEITLSEHLIIVLIRFRAIREWRRRGAMFIKPVECGGQ
jgi:hypothetical protein